MIALLSPLFLLSSCSSSSDGMDEPNPKDEKLEIGFNADVWKLTEATRATFYAPGDLTSGSFTVAAYEADSNPLVAYISPVQVVWDSDANRWVFADGSHYWPLPATNGGAWPSLDFFGYMPSAANLSTYAPYISSINYTADHNVTFTCSSLPMSYSSATPTAGQGSSLTEFVYGMALAKNYGNASGGVTLQFQHPFARIKLQLAASHPDITINSITFKSIKNNGSYDHNATPKWTLSDDAADFVLTLTGAAAVFDNNPASPTQIGVPYIMIPQVWAGEIVVNATWIDWGEQIAHTVSTTLPSSVTWQPGYNYTYTFTISEADLKVNIENYTEQW